MPPELPPAVPQPSVLPESGPYLTFRNQQAAGFMLQAICLEKPGIVRYLRERGLNLVTPLDIATCEMSPKMFMLRNDASPYVKALQSIHQKEAAGDLPMGSVAEATNALFSGEFEESTWYQFVDLTGIPPNASQP